MSLLYLSLGLGVLAIATPSSLHASDRPVVAARATTSPIHVDGVLDEADWALAEPARDFRLILQRQGEAPSESTEVRVLFDSGRLYFGIRCANAGPGAIRASLAPRDQITDGDFVALHLDTYLDRRRAYIFGINPFGVQLDGILDGSDPDFSWDAVWDAETQRRADGWTAEVVIPFAAIRFPRGGASTWGLWIRREITKNDEVCSWPLWRQEDQGDIMLQAADLTGLSGAARGRGLEVEPYASSASTTRRFYRFPPDFGYRSITRDDHAVGVDARFSVTSALVANATVNPDYSQVEADAIQIDVNQRYPLYFPEKRPFFLEGAEIFSDPLGLIYTRRIADPEAGLKLSGKLGGWSVGAMSLRDEGGGSTEGVGAPLAASEPDGGSVTPRGWFHVGRMSRDLGENSRLGILVATHHASYRPGVAPVEGSNANAVLAGDARLRLGTNVFFTGELAWSRTRVDSVPASASGASRSFSGLAYDASIRFADGTGELEAYQRSFGPDFRNETGFVERVDVRETGMRTSYIVRPENRWLRSWQPRVESYSIHDHEGGLQEWRVVPSVNWEFQKQTTVYLEAARTRERWLGRDYGLRTANIEIENTLWRLLAVTFEAEVGDGIFYGETDAESFRGWLETYAGTATARPDPRFTSEVSVARRRFSRDFGGEEIFDVWALGAKTTYQFTRRLFARVYPQYDTGSKHLDADALVGWVLHPGTVFYLGANGDFDRLERKHRLTQHGLFAKASYRFGVG